jgi:hypothetical protein
LAALQHGGVLCVAGGLANIAGMANHKNINTSTLGLERVFMLAVIGVRLFYNGEIWGICLP